jgi:DNA-binding transcriptional LysR family regulator
MFQQMTTFIRIAEMGSITRAARSLGLSLPMASRHLRWLEEELGTALVHRTTRQLHLTAAGEEFAVRARALLLGLEEARQAVRPGPTVAGRVVITAPNALGMYQLSSIMPSLAARHPQLRVELRLDDRALDIVKEGVDLAIRAGTPPDQASLVARELATYGRMVCAAPSFLARHGAVESVDDLARVPCVVHGCGDGVWRFETPEGQKPIAVDGPLRTNNVVVVRDAILAGVGAGWLPDYVMGDELRDGRLVRLLPDAKLPPIRVFGITPKEARRNAAVRVVLDVLGSGLQEQAAKVAA